jgi:LmbE family N-acetylglucosaminyl deacetylase
VSPLYNLLLSPHPDDLVFSAFSVVTKKRNNLALVFFNVSSFTRWPIKSRKLVTGYRTLEDRAILNSLGAKVKYLNLEDNSLKKSGQILQLSDKESKLEPPERIYSPLGVGNSPNHLEVRDWAIKRWISWKKQSTLYFYEDLPYAAKLENAGSAEKTIIDELEKACGPIEQVKEHLTESQISRKVRLCKSYFSQTDYSEMIGNHAKSVGSAEIFYRAV